MENFETDYLNNLDLEVDPDTSIALKDASKWAKFISIIMFVFCGIMLLAFLLGGQQFAKGFNEGIQRYNVNFYISDITVVIIIVAVAILFIAAIYFFLMKFSVKVKKSLVEQNTDELNAGLNSLKVYFIFAAASVLGICSSIYALITSF